MLIFYAAEIVGKAGIKAFADGLSLVQKERSPDFVAVNADGATHGGGLGLQHAFYLRKLGAHAITLGDFCFYKKDLTQKLSELPFVIRPYNLVQGAPGHGYYIYRTANGEKAACVSILGQAGFAKLHAESPYLLIAPLLKKLRKETPHIIVDIHALATAEKAAFARAADGLCSAVLGSHTRVQTAHPAILAGGTAFMSCVGRTGSALSVSGLESESMLDEYRSGIPVHHKEAEASPVMQGVLIKTRDDGSAEWIETV